MEEKSVNYFREGLRYYNNKNYTKAVELWTIAAEQGNAAAQNNLGARYAMGQGVAQDYVKAAEWYQKAAEQGDKAAQNNLGYLYEKGQGVEQSYQKAVEWYQKAKEQGSEEAQAKLDACYEKYIESNPDFKCTNCKNELGESDAKAHVAKYNVLCLDCYRGFLDSNYIKAKEIQSNIKNDYILMFIGVLIGFAIGLTLFLTVGLNVPGYVPFRWPVLIYLTFGFAPLLLVLWQFIPKKKRRHKKRGMFFDFSLLYIIIWVVIIIGLPFYTIYNFVTNAKNLSRLKEIRKINAETITYIDDRLAQAGSGETRQILEAYPNNAECIKKNALLAKIEKSY